MEELPLCQAGGESWLGSTSGALNPIGQWFTTKGDFGSLPCPLPRGPLAMSGGIFGCPNSIYPYSSG